MVYDFILDVNNATEVHHSEVFPQSIEQIHKSSPLRLYLEYDIIVGFRLCGIQVLNDFLKNIEITGHGHKHLDRGDVGQFAVIIAARSLKVIFDLHQCVQNFLSNLKPLTLKVEFILRLSLVLGIFLCEVETPRKDVKDPEDWEPPKIICLIQILADIGHLFQHVEEKAVIFLFKKNLAALFKHALALFVAGHHDFANDLAIFKVLLLRIIVLYTDL